MTDIKETDLYELLEIETGITYKNKKKKISVAIDGKFYQELEYIGIRHCRDIDQPVLLATEWKWVQEKNKALHFLHIFPVEKIQFYSLKLDENISNIEKIIDSVCYLDEKKEND